MVRRLRGTQRAKDHREASTRLTVALSDVDFPATKEDVAEKIGDTRVKLRDDADEEVSVNEMLRYVDRERFATRSMAQSELERHWQAYRADKGLQEPPPDTFTDPGSSGH